MTNLPDLGPRGEGWVLLQGSLLLALALAGILAGGVWSGGIAALTAVAGPILMVVGLGLRFWSRRLLGRSLTWMPRPVQDGSLVETGAYAIVRHPLYGGLIIAAVGWGLLAASPLALILAGGLGLVFDLKARREEAWLVEHYAGYAAYMDRTRRLIPWIY